MKENAVGVGFLLFFAAGCARSAPEKAPYQGIVELDESVLGFEVAGRVLSVPVKRGDSVKDGELVAQVDDTLARLTRDERAEDAAAAKADLALLEAGSRREDIGSLAAQVNAARAAEDLAVKAAARVQSLAATGSLPQAEVDRAESDKTRTAAERRSMEQRLAAMQRGARPEELTRARARVASSASLLELEEERLARCSLKAKRAAIVTDVHVEPGELAQVGTPAVTVADVAHPYVDVFVPQADLGGLRVGTKASALVDASNDAASGTIEWISPRTEFTPRFLFSERERPHLVVRVRVRLDDGAQRLHAGVPAFVRLLP